MVDKILIGIIATCILALIIGVLRHRLEVLVNIILRMAVGIVGIYLLNTFLNGQNIAASVGINEVNILTLGLLGLPGFLLIYGIEFYFLWVK